jgi:hypothetical protein
VGTSAKTQLHCNNAIQPGDLLRPVINNPNEVRDCFGIAETQSSVSMLRPCPALITMNSGLSKMARFVLCPILWGDHARDATLADIFSRSPAIDIILFKVLVSGPERVIIAAVVELLFSGTYRGYLLSINQGLNWDIFFSVFT